MANNPGNDRNLEKQISREQLCDDDNSKPLPTSDPTPTVEGTPMHDQGDESGGGRAVVLATDVGAIVESSGVGAGVAAAVGGRDKGKVEAAPRSGDEKMMGRKNVGDPGASSSGGGVEKKSRKRCTRTNSNPKRCRVCDRVFKSCHAVYGHMIAHSNKRRANKVLCLPASAPSFSERNGGSGALVLYVAQAVQFGPALPRPDCLIIDLNEPPPQEEEEDCGENKDGDNGAAK